MNSNIEYNQVCLPTYSAYKPLKSLNILSGKVVDKVGFANEPGEQNLLVITFTDKTYISLSIERDDDEHYYLENDWMARVGPGNVNGGIQDHWIDSQGKLHFDRYVQCLIDTGIWNVTEEEVEKLIKERDKHYEETEYAQYLRLKEKFENKE